MSSFSTSSLTSSLNSSSSSPRIGFSSSTIVGNKVLTPAPESDPKKRYFYCSNGHNDGKYSRIYHLLNMGFGYTDSYSEPGLATNIIADIIRKTPAMCSSSNSSMSTSYLANDLTGKQYPYLFSIYISDSRDIILNSIITFKILKNCRISSRMDKNGINLHICSFCTNMVLKDDGGNPLSNGTKLLKDIMNVVSHSPRISNCISLEAIPSHHLMGLYERRGFGKVGTPGGLQPMDLTVTSPLQSRESSDESSAESSVATTESVQQLLSNFTFNPSDTSNSKSIILNLENDSENSINLLSDLILSGNISLTNKEPLAEIEEADWDFLRRNIQPHKPTKAATGKHGKHSRIALTKAQQERLARHGKHSRIALTKAQQERLATHGKNTHGKKLSKAQQERLATKAATEMDSESKLSTSDNEYGGDEEDEEDDEDDEDEEDKEDDEMIHGGYKSKHRKRKTQKNRKRKTQKKIKRKTNKKRKPRKFISKNYNYK
jgi:hypothetical protein